MTITLKGNNWVLLRVFLPYRSSPGKLLSPSKRRKIVKHVCQNLAVSERRACEVLSQVRAAQMPNPKIPSNETQLTENIPVPATKYGRDGYRKITALLNCSASSGAAKRI
ncbi:hypothetical protein ACFLXC_05335 [Chloroflexota bacterium]